MYENTYYIYIIKNIYICICKSAVKCIFISKFMHNNHVLVLWMRVIYPMVVQLKIMIICGIKFGQTFKQPRYYFECHYIVQKLWANSLTS